jgi:hypothetical protein
MDGHVARMGYKKCIQTFGWKPWKVEKIWETNSKGQSPSWETNTRLAKKFPAFYDSRRFIVVIRRVRHLSRARPRCK